MYQVIYELFWTPFPKTVCLAKTVFSEDSFLASIQKTKFLVLSCQDKI